MFQRREMSKLAEAAPPYHVHHRREISTIPKLGETLLTLAVTYSTLELPPHTLFIPKADHTPELEDEMILKDIERRKAERV